MADITFIPAPRADEAKESSLQGLIDLNENIEQWFVRVTDALERLNDQAQLVTGMELQKNERL